MIMVFEPHFWPFIAFKAASAVYQLIIHGLDE